LAWDERRQCPIIQVYVGDNDAAVTAAQNTVANIVGRNCPTSVALGARVALHVSLSIVMRPGRKAADVQSDVLAALTGGVLASSAYYIGRPPPEGEIRAACFDVPNVLGARARISGMPQDWTEGTRFVVPAENIEISVEVEGDD
jgi:hypothetical protein